MKLQSEFGLGSWACGVRPSSRRPAFAWHNRFNSFSFSLPVRRACLCALLLLLPGCATRRCGDFILGPSYRPTNIYGRNWAHFTPLRRVAVLPGAVGSGSAELEDGQTLLDPVLQQELGKTKSFESVRIAPEDLVAWTGQARWSTAGPLPAGLLAQLRDQFGCDGVLFAELTQFHAYPPLVIGWNLKLVEIKSGQVLWAADEVFDAGQPAVEAGARRYQAKHAQVCGPLADSRFILLSPSAFGHYAAEALWATFSP